jgi:hypothetical protein
LALEQRRLMAGLSFFLFFLFRSITCGAVQFFLITIKTNDMKAKLHEHKKQTNKSVRKQTIELNIPKQLTMLCELLETTPQEILQAFINDVSLEVNSSGSDERRMAVEYFMRVGYGMHRYNFEEVEQMFDGLNWLRYQQYETRGKAFAGLRTKFLNEWFTEWKAKMKTM